MTRVFRMLNRWTSPFVCLKPRSVAIKCILCLTVAAFLLYCHLHSVFIGHERDVTINPRDASELVKLKKILVWHYAFKSKSLWFGFGQRPFVENCQERRCILTQNRNLVEFKDFDAIIFHFRLLNLRKLPNYRFAKQRWIFLESEPAAYIFNNLHWYNNFFNWTMTYRRDSDIQFRYGYTSNKTGSGKDLRPRNYAKEKGRLVAWVVSRCQSSSRREKVAESLGKFLQVDVYGNCGEDCPEDDDCFKMIERKYKFYLSFENSFCRDYASEKLFNILKLDLVPIVYGAANYSAIAPPHSVINVADFSTVEELANYLKYLDKNDTAYNEYFNWKSKFESAGPKAATARALCDLCEKLHQDDPVKIYKDMYAWFVRDQCIEKLPVGLWESLKDIVMQNFHLPLL